MLNRAETAVYETDATADILAISGLMFPAIRDETSPSDYQGNPSAKAVSTFLRSAIQVGVTADTLRGLRRGVPGDVDPAQMPVAFQEYPFMAELLLVIVGNGSFDMLRA